MMMIKDIADVDKGENTLMMMLMALIMVLIIC